MRILGIDGTARRADSRDRILERKQRIGCIARRILDREPRHPGVHAHPHALGDLARRGRITRLEIGVHRQITRSHDRRHVRQHRVAPYRGVRQAERPGRARARGGDCLEPEMLEIARGADVPRIGDDEAAARMQCAERATLFGDGGHRNSYLSQRTLLPPL